MRVPGNGPHSHMGRAARRRLLGALAVERDGLGAAGHCKGTKLLGKGIVEILALATTDPELAGRWRPWSKLGGVRLGKVEGDEIRWVRHGEGQSLAFRRHRLGKGQGKIERQLLVLILEPVVAGHLQLDLPTRQRSRGEVGELLEAVDVHLGQLGKLFTVVFAVLVFVQALDRHGRVVLVEGPLVVQAGEGTLVVKQRGLNDDPHVRVRRRWADQHPAQQSQASDDGNTIGRRSRHWLDPLRCTGPAIGPGGAKSQSHNEGNTTAARLFKRQTCQLLRYNIACAAAKRKSPSSPQRIRGCDARRRPHWRLCCCWPGRRRRAQPPRWLSAASPCMPWSPR